MPSSHERPTKLAAVAALCSVFLVAWACSIVLYAINYAPFARWLLTSDFVIHRLAAPFRYERQALRGIHIGRITPFADRLARELPEDATVYLEIDEQGRPAATTQKEAEGKRFDNYAYLVYKLYPRHVYGATPGRPIRDPVLYPPGAVTEDSEALARRVDAERVGLPRSAEWLSEHRFDYHVIFNPYTGKALFGPVPRRW